jgi:hypothetical protein
MRRLLLVGLAASLLLLAACGGTNPTPTPTPSSGVQGILLFPGTYVGGPSPLPGGFGTTKLGQPYPSTPIEVRAKTGQNAGAVVAKVTTTGRSGLFTVALPPGTYILTPLVPVNSEPWPVPKTVVVKSGKYTRTVVYLEGRL